MKLSHKNYIISQGTPASVLLEPVEIVFFRWISTDSREIFVLFDRPQPDDVTSIILTSVAVGEMAKNLC